MAHDLNYKYESTECAFSSLLFLNTYTVQKLIYTYKDIKLVCVCDTIHFCT